MECVIPIFQRGDGLLMKKSVKTLAVFITSITIALCGIFSFAAPVYAADDGNTGQESLDGLTDPIRITYYIDEGKTYPDKYFEKGDDTAVVIYSMPTKKGIIYNYVFCGWSTRPDQTLPSQVDYNPGDSIETSKSLTLYAVWGYAEKGDPLTASGNGETYVYDGNSHSISGIEEKDDGKVAFNGNCYANGFFHQSSEDIPYVVYYYTSFEYVYAEGTDTGSYSTPIASFIYQSTDDGLDPTWALYEDRVTVIRRATMTITKAPLTVTAPDQRAKYTGDDITPEGTIEGLVTPTGKDKETATLNLDPFKEVGRHQIEEYSISWDGTAKKRNYKIESEDLGILTIYYELSFDGNGGENAPETMEVETDSAAIPSTAPTREGYKFLGWANNQDATEAEYQPGDTINLDNNKVLYAVWEAPEYSLTFDPNGGTWADGTTDPKIISPVHKGDVVKTLEAPTKEGFTFDHWEGSTYDAGADYVVDGDHTFTAVWKENESPNPETGDHSNFMIWLSLMSVSLITILITIYSSLRKTER